MSRHATDRRTEGQTTEGILECLRPYGGGGITTRSQKQYRQVLAITHYHIALSVHVVQKIAIICAQKIFCGKSYRSKCIEFSIIIDHF